MLDIRRHRTLGTTARIGPFLALLLATPSAASPFGETCSGGGGEDAIGMALFSGAGNMWDGGHDVLPAPALNAPPFADGWRPPGLVRDEGPVAGGPPQGIPTGPPQGIPPSPSGTGIDVPPISAGSGAVAAPAVPEPSAALLFSVGFGTFALRRRLYARGRGPA